jgi:hypothetical protein
MSQVTNPYCERLGIEVPSLASVRVADVDASLPEQTRGPILTAC